MEDCLIVSIDISKGDRPTLLVTRSMGEFSFAVVNQLWDDEAVETYKKLIGNVKKSCKTCKYSNIAGCYYCAHQKHLGDYVQPYTICDDYEAK